MVIMNTHVDQKCIGSSPFLAPSQPLPKSLPLSQLPVGPCGARARWSLRGSVKWYCSGDEGDKDKKKLKNDRKKSSFIIFKDDIFEQFRTLVRAWFCFWRKIIMMITDKNTKNIPSTSGMPRVWKAWEVWPPQEATTFQNGNPHIYDLDFLQLPL